MKKKYILLLIMFIFLNLFAVSAHENETAICENSDIVTSVNSTETVVENPAVSIETSISNSSIYIGNSTEVTVTVKNIANHELNNISITTVQTMADILFMGNYDPVFYACIGTPDTIDTLHLDKFESINASWNYQIKSNDTFNFYLHDPLKVNQTCGFKVIFNTKKVDFYSYVNLYSILYSNNTMLNHTFNKISISQIPRTVYINRKIENNTLIINATMSSLDNSIFSGTYPVKIADDLFSLSGRKEEFKSVLINFVNNTGTASVKLPLETEIVYGMGLIMYPPIYSVYSYNFVYDSFDEMLVQNFGVKNLVKLYKNESQFVVDAKNLSCDNITFKINGVKYVRQVNESGFAKLNINLDPGVYTIESFTDKYHLMNTVTVLPTLIADNLVKYYRNDSQFYVKLVDFANNTVASANVTFNIHGVFYTRQTNAYGITCLNINLDPGEYIITVFDPLTGLQVSYNITVLSILYGNDTTVHYKDPCNHVVKLVDGKGDALPGKKVFFNINGVYYQNVTDSDGNARILVNLMPGEYIITAMHIDAEISNKIVVLKD